MERWRRLQSTLDADRFITFLAMERLLGHRDGYSGNLNNYRIYQDPRGQRMVFLMHGVDDAFRSGLVFLQPPVRSLAVRAVIQTWEGRRLYRQSAEQLFTNVFRLDSLTNRVVQAAGRLRDAARSAAEVKAIDEEAARVCATIMERDAGIRAALRDMDLPRLRFDASGAARLGQGPWQTFSSTNSARFSEVSEDGRRLLRTEFDAGLRSAMACWRQRVLLEPGRYRWQGKVRTTGTVAPSGVGREFGAGLFVSGAADKKGYHHGEAWGELKYDFEVQWGPLEVELICDLFGRAGTAWFDAASLVLTRRD